MAAAAIPSTHGWVDVTRRWNPDAQTVRPADPMSVETDAIDLGTCEGGVGYACHADATDLDGLCDECRERRHELDGDR